MRCKSMAKRESARKWRKNSKGKRVNKKKVEKALQIAPTQVCVRSAGCDKQLFRDYRFHGLVVREQARDLDDLAELGLAVELLCSRFALRRANRFQVLLGAVQLLNPVERGQRALNNELLNRFQDPLLRKALALAQQ